MGDDLFTLPTFPVEIRAPARGLKLHFAYYAAADKRSRKTGYFLENNPSGSTVKLIPIRDPRRDIQNLSRLTFDES